MALRKKSECNTVDFKFLGSMCSQKNFCFCNCQMQFHVPHIEVCNSVKNKPTPLQEQGDVLYVYKYMQIYFLHYGKLYKI